LRWAAQVQAVAAQWGRKEKRERRRRRRGEHTIDGRW